MAKGTGWGAAGLLLLFLVLGAGTASATTTTYYGCFICKSTTLTGLGAICDGVGVLQGGDGWECYEDNTLPWPDGPSCWVAGGPCTNGGDGGGGSGGTIGGSDSCQTTGFCSAECFSCSGSGRPHAN